MKARRKKTSWSKSLVRIIQAIAAPLRGSARPIVIVLGMFLLLAIGAVYARHRWPELLTSANGETLDAQHILITPQPDWIESDVKADVVGSGQLVDLNLLDRELAARVADAFAVHSWVAEVVSVTKHAGPLVAVELRYRRPVAMVEVKAGGHEGLLPIDQEGVLLPPEEFLLPQKIRQYLRVTVSDAQPAGPIGTSWGDQRVAGAARIAAAWGDRWKELGLYRIAALGERPRHAAPAAIDYQLYTRQGTRILWGRPPGEEHSGEPSAEQKIARLIQYVADNGPLDGQSGDGDVDLRDNQSLRLTPRTAQPPRSRVSPRLGKRVQ